MNQQQKEYWLKTMCEHAEADRLIQGLWITDKDDTGVFRGCFFGCAMQTMDEPIEKAAAAMGVPYDVLALAEKIFEGLPKNEALQWPVQFLEAVPVDADLSNVRHLVAIKRMERLLELHKDLGEKYGLLDAIRLTIEYHKKPTESAIRSAADAAEAVVARAAEAVRSAAYSAARPMDAVRSAAYSVRSATEVARSAGSAEDAAVAAWQQERDALIEVLTTGDV